MPKNLPPPARYFPIDRGLYEVAPGLKVLGSPFGNGARDTQVFQLDDEFTRYRQNRLAARSESLEKYVAETDYSPEVARAFTRWMLDRLTGHHPELFRVRTGRHGGPELECRLTREILDFDEDLALCAQSGGAEGGTPAYVSAFDALSSQVQEDIAVMRADSEKDWLAAIHLCSPNHWAAGDNIGLPFFAIHEPIPGIEKVNQAARSLIQAMISKGPYVRFAWGVASDTRLNHHPDPPPGWEADVWRGRLMSEMLHAENPFFLRIERQVLWGLPEVSAFVFTIRTYFVPASEVRRNERERIQLRAALESMTPESQVYKGVRESLPELLRWLDSG